MRCSQQRNGIAVAPHVMHHLCRIDERRRQIGLKLQRDLKPPQRRL